MAIKYDVATGRYIDEATGQVIGLPGQPGGALPSSYPTQGFVYPPMEPEAPAPLAPEPSGYTGLGFFPWETPAGVGFNLPWTPKIAPSSTQVQAATLLPAAVGAIAGGGILGGLAAVGGAAYGAAQLFGVQFPWETGPGEGFISPITPQVRDEQGQWVTPTTRPDLFTPETAGRMAGLLAPTNGHAGKIIGGDVVVSSWRTGPAGWLFYRLASGKIGTFTRQGMWKTWRPKKHIILPRGTTTLSQAVKAQRYLDKLWRTVAKKTKAIKMA